MILVTGSSGFLGKAISERLGDEVVELSRSEKDQTKEQIVFDLTQFENAEELALQLKEKNVTQIIHAAAITPWSSNAPDYSLDLAMAKTLVATSKITDIENLIYLSGWNVYDMQSGEPPYDEQTPLRATEDYGKSKQNVEQYLQNNIPKSQLTILRLSSVYGPGQISSGLIPNLVKSALETQELTINAQQTRRDYLYIEDFLSAIARLTAMSSRPSIMNIGSGASVSVEEVAETIQSVCSNEFGLNPTIKLADEISESQLADNRLSIELARSHELLQESTSFEQGLRQYIKWVKHENIF